MLGAFIFIIIVKMRKANESFANEEVSITVEWVGLRAKDYVFDHEPTVKEVLNRAGLPENADCRCDWEIAELEDELMDGDVLVVATKKITQW